MDFNYKYVNGSEMFPRICVYVEQIVTIVKQLKNLTNKEPIFREPIRSAKEILHQTFCNHDINIVPPRPCFCSLAAIKVRFLVENA